MQIETFDDPAEVARRTAEIIAAAAAEGTRRRGRSLLAFSGGSTPAAMLGELGALPLDWSTVHVLQVDERVAPDGHPDRNWTMVRERLLAAVDVPASQQHPMPVTEDDLVAAAARYARVLTTVAGVPPAIDVVHLGVGGDGHTASLVPGDPVLDLRQQWVGVTGAYQGRRRMTLTYPAINAARLLVWQVAGADKADALRAALQGSGVPASRVRRERVHVVATSDAAAGLDLG